MWKRTEVVEGEQCRIGLKASSDGQRTTALVREGDDLTEFDFVTEIVDDFEALQNRNLPKILEATSLSDGTHVCLDAHNIWFTHAEMNQLKENSYDFSAVEWHRGVPPQLAPK